MARNVLKRTRKRGAQPNPDASRVWLDGRCRRRPLLRARDLPRLIALWPQELEDQTSEGSLLILSKLRRALRAERRHALAGHWSYELNRHLGLMTAYKAELGLMRRAKFRPSRTAPAAAQSTSAAAAPAPGEGVVRPSRE